ncbi:MAG TPA: PadR family transcriptional regulator [Terriglobales bacterium]|jgi:transcriptional regulator
MGTDALQGSLALLVLKALSRGPAAGMHGFGIASYVQQVSEELLRIEEGSLYPALHRMEEAGWISAAWGLTENRRRARYYRLTAAGRRELDRQVQSWRQVTGAVATVLES